MPTYGWIQERVQERYWETQSARDHTRVFAPVRFACPLCAGEFASDRERMAHIGREHPISLPSVSVRGRILGGDTRIRARLEAEEVQAVNVTNVQARSNGGDPVEWAANELSQRLSSVNDGIVDLVLTNSRSDDGRTVSTELTLRFEVPTTQDLDAVDKAFITLAAVPDLKLRDITRFSNAVRRYRSAEGYVDALYHYAVGILAKDQRADAGGNLPFEEYPARLQRSLEVLGEYDERPVACAIVGCIRVAINDLRQRPRPTGIPLLDSFAAFLCSCAERTPPDTASQSPLAGQLATLCPVDVATDQLLQDFATTWIHGDVDRAGQLVERIANGNLAAYDRVKYCVLAAAALGRYGDSSRGEPALRQIAHDSVFGAWATARLAALGS